MNLYNSNGRWCFISLVRAVSTKAAKLLLGNGTTKTHPLDEGKRLLEKWDSEIDFENILYQVEDRCSEYGWTLILPSRSETGKMSLTLALPWQQKQVAFISNEVSGTAVYSRIRYDDSAPIMRTYYTTTEIRREFGQLIDGQFSINGDSQKIADELKLKTKEVHNLGFVPVIYVPNLPYQDPFNSTNPFAYPDSAAVAKLQRLLDHTFEQLWEEIENNKTRVFGNFTQEEMKYQRMMQDPFIKDNYAHRNLTKLMKSSLLINSRQEATEGNPVVPMIANPQFPSYTALIHDIIKWYFEFSGYSWSEDVSTQKTESEIVLMSARDAETTRIKRTMRTRLYKKLLYMLGRLEGKEDWFCQQFSFEINENIAVDRFKQVELSQALIQARLSTRLDEIAKISGLNEEDAKAKKEEIDEEYRTEMSQFMPQEETVQEETLKVDNQ